MQRRKLLRRAARVALRIVQRGHRRRLGNRRLLSLQIFLSLLRRVLCRRSACSLSILPSCREDLLTRDILELYLVLGLRTLPVLLRA